MNITYISAASDDNVISSKPAILERIIVGEDIGSSVIEISDDTSDGDGNVKIQIEGDKLLGVYDIGAIFRKGITSNLTNQTKVAFIWRPTSI
jgi:hypothetical protein